MFHVFWIFFSVFFCLLFVIFSLIFLFYVFVTYTYMNYTPCITINILLALTCHLHLHRLHHAKHICWCILLVLSCWVENDPPLTQKFLYVLMCVLYLQLLNTIWLLCLGAVALWKSGVGGVGGYICCDFFVLFCDVWRCVKMCM